ncbi:MAG: hypothetical protein JW751_11310 [Polyangiaceae bacterium]|nr:hypothetical protein [Polyangiaceae bacterium]
MVYLESSLRVKWVGALAMLLLSPCGCGREPSSSGDRTGAQAGDDGTGAAEVGGNG